MTGPCHPGAANRAPRSDREEDVQPQHGRREHERESDEPLHQELAAPFGEGEPVSDRHTDHQQNERDDRREPDAQRDRSPVHQLCLTPKPKSARSLSESDCFRKSRKARAAFSFFVLRSTTAACRIGGCIVEGISEYVPADFSAGASATDSARIPTSAFPDCTN